MLKTDASSCSPVGLRYVCSIATIFSWPVWKVDFDTVILQSGDSKQDVYVRPPKKCASPHKFPCLLLTASYGLVNANYKWQMESDYCLYQFGMAQLPEVPQLFFLKSHGKLVLVADKVVDDILIAGCLSRTRNLVKHI